MSQNLSQLNFERVGVVGSGQMGAGIAQVLATSGLEVVLMDREAKQVENARKNIMLSVDKLVQKNLLTAEQKNQAAQIQFTFELKDLSRCELIIEAIAENEQTKRELFQALDCMVSDTCVFASNTSSIPITKLASATKRPQLFIGMHFMNPVPLMKLVEVISGMATSPQTLDRIKRLALHLGKEVTASQDYPGFVVNRILMPMINEAFDALMQNIATADDIDRGMKLGTNQPMGPLQLADFIGLDTCLAIMRVLHQGFGESKYRPSPLLVKYVEAGFYGRKTKRGVYAY